MYNKKNMMLVMLPGVLSREGCHLIDILFHVLSYMYIQIPVDNISIWTRSNFNIFSCH